MKTYLLLLPLFLAASCGDKDGILRCDRPRSSYSHGSGQECADSASGPSVTSRRDTAVLYTALHCDGDYDWRRDTAYGAADYHVRLYRGDDLVLDLPAGDGCFISPDPDMHHLIDGHVYTEFSTTSETVVSRDGTELFRFSGREFLKGLLPLGDDVYTLSLPRDGDGFSFRRNGELLLSERSAFIYGGFDQPSYLPYGALYEDCGCCMFAFRNESGCYGVKDGEAGEIEWLRNEAEVRDLRCRDGSWLCCTSKAFGFTWARASIWAYGGSYVVTGDISFTYSSLGRSAVYDAVNGSFLNLELGCSAVYYDPVSGVRGLFRMDDGTLFLLGEGGIEKYDGHYRYMPPACASLDGGRFTVGLTPLDTLSPPRVESGGEVYVPDGLNGMITAVALEIG